MSFAPAGPLRAAAHYRVSINRAGSLRCAGTPPGAPLGAAARVDGELAWSFFTARARPALPAAPTTTPRRQPPPRGANHHLDGANQHPAVS